MLKQGVALNDVYRTIQAFMGGLFVNYFNRFGRQWQVYVEAEGEYRTNAENVGQFYVRNNQGEMVPLSALTQFESRSGPEFTMRYNLYRSAQIIGGAAPGYSSAQAMKALEETFEQTMPREMGFDYMGMSLPGEEGAGRRPDLGDLRLLAAVRVPDSGRALRELVAAVQRAAEHAGRGLRRLRRAVAAALADGLFLPAYMVQIENDVYSQIGLVMLIGLAAKNAILIVEFAKDEVRTAARPLVDAALEGARLRLRPILMTSFAFILGCVPLWTASGAGAVGAPDHGHHRDRRHAGRERHRHLPHPGDLLRGGEAVGRRAGRPIRPRRLRRRKEIDMRAHRSARSPPAAVCWPAAPSARTTSGPQVPAPATFPRAGPAARTPQAASLADLKWFEVFQDEKLQELIRTALVQNYDLRDAVARVEQARANLGITRSNQLPQVDAGGRTDKSPACRAMDRLRCRRRSCASQNRNLGQATLNLLSFEIDIWGRLRRATEVGARRSAGRRREPQSGRNARW